MRAGPRPGLLRSLGGALRATTVIAGLSLAALGSLVAFGWGQPDAPEASVFRPGVPATLAAPEPGPQVMALVPALPARGPLNTPQAEFFHAALSFIHRDGDRAILTGPPERSGRHAVDDQVMLRIHCAGQEEQRLVLDYRQQQGKASVIAEQEPRDLTDRLTPGPCVVEATLIDVWAPYHGGGPLFLQLYPAATREPVEGGRPAAPGPLLPGDLLTLLGVALATLGLAVVGAGTLLPHLARAVGMVSGPAVDRMRAVAPVQVRVRSLRSRWAGVVELAPGQQRRLRVPGLEAPLWLRRSGRDRQIEVDDDVLNATTPLVMRPGVIVELQG